MFQALHASRSGHLYRVQLTGAADIADLVREDRLDTITTRAGDVFWFTPAIHSSHMKLNRQATQLLFGATRFTARQVPLLRGNVVITGVDRRGRPAGLADPQLDYLADVEPTTRELWVLTWRYARDRRTRRRASRGADAAHMGAITRPWT